MIEIKLSRISYYLRIDKILIYKIKHNNPNKLKINKILIPLIYYYKIKIRKIKNL